MSAATTSAVDEFNRASAAFAQLHVGSDSQRYIANLATRVEMLNVGELSLPATINEDEPGNAWVCSPRTAYADYAAEEAVRYAPSWAAPALRALGRFGARRLQRARIDRAVAINNWLLSTNLYPPLAATPLPQLLDAARQRWPRHALWLRSLNEREHGDWLAQLRALGFELIGSRQVYLYRDVAGLARRRHNLAMDLRLAAKRAGRAGNDQIGEADYERIAHLYRRLYLDKYSVCNPHYRAEFMRQWHRRGLLHFDGFRDPAGQLLCVAGQFRLGGGLTTPIVGYDTDRPQREGLYRLATACTFEHALRSGETINFSAGAAHFKRLRGGEPAIEYSAVYARHLPPATRRAIAFLAAATRRLGVPIMRRFAL
ncbi:hypothetical protein ABU614_23095 [Lysobacter firmicutimachus]|uniref:BioF2-like acetyltransferase domain-containing protein n=1 Tax=Lysobacter firmicutimachus TaxID=1792846 RepID=A0AAU8MSA8_9GAMM